MRKTDSRFALVAVIPAVMIPVLFLLQGHHASDVVTGLFTGACIGTMIVLLMVGLRGSRRRSEGSERHTGR